jgi:DNA-binding XRE family transcriptional regulator
MTFVNTLDTLDWEQQLGAQFRAARLEAELDQATLAKRANVSEGAIKALEAGRGSTLKTLVKVLRAKSQSVRCKH